MIEKNCKLQVALFFCKAYITHHCHPPLLLKCSKRIKETALLCIILLEYHFLVKLKFNDALFNVI